MIWFYRFLFNISDSPKLHPRQETIQYVFVDLNDSVTFTVSVMAYPKPTFYWTRQFKSESKLNHQEKYADSITISFLELTKIGEDDFTTYFCTAENTMGTVEIRFVLKPKGMYQNSKLNCF